MNKETFTRIQAFMEGRIAACHFYLNNIENTQDLKALTIEQAQTLQRFCRQEETTMTKFVQNDLYHLVGMGELTPPQMMKLTYLTKDWLQYRSTVKALAMNLDKISQLPNIPVASVYVCKTFDLTLSSDLEALDYQKSIEIPYAISGNLIQVLKEDLSKFLSFWSNKSKTNFSENNFIQKLKASAEYGGVRWTEDNTGNYVGVIKQDNVQQLFEGCANKPAQ